jgi:D-arabinose 1-dehydrogenase-like Zn-dependent alcohol dehydrogenase
MKTVRIVRTKEPLEIQELETPKIPGLGGSHKVQSSGLCHSDAWT